MRDFFKSELKTLKAKTGLNQWENISAMDNPEQEFKILFDSLELVCAEFTYIPDNDKKRIVQENIIRDQEFKGLNARIVWKWLNANKDKYYKELAHQQADQIAPPLVGEERQKRIAEYLEVLAKVQVQTTMPTSRFKEVKEQWKAPEGEQYKPLSKEDVALKEFHLEYLQSQVGKKPSEFDDEMEWMISKGYIENI